MKKCANRWKRIRWDFETGRRKTLENTNKTPLMTLVLLKNRWMWKHCMDKEAAWVFKGKCSCIGWMFTFMSGCGVQNVPYKVTLILDSLHSGLGLEKCFLVGIRLWATEPAHKAAESFQTSWWSVERFRGLFLKKPRRFKKAWQRALVLCR